MVFVFVPLSWLVLGCFFHARVVLDDTVRIILGLSVGVKERGGVNN